MDYPKFIVSNEKEESISIERIKYQTLMLWFICYGKQLYPYAWVKDQNFQNPELLKFKFLNVHDAYKMDNLNLKLCLDNMKTNHRSYYNLLNSAF